MTFPLDYTVELQLDGVWTDISSDCYQRDPITISRGRTAEGALVEPSRCNLTLNNRSGDYSPRNPTGAHFGVLGRNTPLRVLTDPVDINGTFEVDAAGWSGFNATVARSTAQARAGVASLSITQTAGVNMWAQRSATGTAGIPVAPNTEYLTSGWVRAATTGRFCDWRVDWYDAAGAFVSTTGPFGGVTNTTTGWTLVEGTATSPATAAFARPLMFVTSVGAGEVHYLDDASFTSARFVGEVPSWPSRWDTSGKDVWVPIEAAGIMRRLGQGQAPLKSSYHRGMISLDDVVAYWPCEDDDAATELASALPGHPPLKFAGDLDLASFTDFKASAPIPTASGLQIRGVVPTYTDTGSVQMRFLMAVPAGGVAALATVGRIYTDGTATRWDIQVTTAGDLDVKVYDSDGVLLLDDGPFVSAVNGKLMRISLELTQDGADADFTARGMEVGAASWTSASNTIAGRTVGRARTVVMNVGGTMDDVALGHVSVQDAIGDFFDAADELNAWSGETAGRRITRLCQEEGITFDVTGGHIDDTVALGYQLPKTLLELLREAADADLGILYEPRHFLGLAYRTRESLYAQAATLALDYAAADLSEIEPVDDDQGTRNDVTVKRDGGAAARAELTTGALSTAAPPDGVGRYDEEVTISVQADAALPDQAGWRLHLGTVDEARYPVLGINLARSNFTADAALTAAAQALDLGDRLTVANPPAWLPPEDIQQLAQGFTETLTRHEWTIDVNCSPASPWDVGVWDDTTGPGEARYSSDGTTLAEALDTTETGVDVSTPTGPVWSAADQPYDLMIGGERMTVTAVAGTGAAQTFTVTRSVNGVVKTHASGAEVRLFKQAVYAL